MQLFEWLQGSTGGAPQPGGLPGPLAVFGVAELYQRYGVAIYARSIIDPAFNDAVAEYASDLEEAIRGQVPPAGTDERTAVSYYLLACAYTLLDGLLGVALYPDDPVSAMVDGDQPAVCLGGLFQVAIGHGLIQVPEHQG